MNKKKLSARQKAARVGLSYAQYCAIISHRGRPSYESARKVALVEGVHVLHLLDPIRYDEAGKPLKIVKNLEAE